LAQVDLAAARRQGKQFVISAMEKAMFVQSVSHGILIVRNAERCLRG
jgi:hypothetical protein